MFIIDCLLLIVYFVLNYWFILNWLFLINKLFIKLIVFYAHFTGSSKERETLPQLITKYNQLCLLFNFLITSPTDTWGYCQGGDWDWDGGYWDGPKVPNPTRGRFKVMALLLMYISLEYHSATVDKLSTVFTELCSFLRTMSTRNIFIYLLKLLTNHTT